MNEATVNITEEKKETREIAQMITKLDKPLKRTAKDTIKGMLMAQEAFKKRNKSKESA